MTFFVSKCMKLNELRNWISFWTKDYRELYCVWQIWLSKSLEGWPDWWPESVIIRGLWPMNHRVFHRVFLSIDRSENNYSLDSNYDLIRYQPTFSNDYSNQVLMIFEDTSIWVSINYCNIGCIMYRTYLCRSVNPKAKKKRLTRCISRE